MYKISFHTEYKILGLTYSPMVYLRFCISIMIHEVKVSEFVKNAENNLNKSGEQDIMLLNKMKNICLIIIPVSLI